MSFPWIDTIAFAVSAAVLYGAVRVVTARPKGSAEVEAPAELQIVTRTRVGIGRTLVLVEVDGRRLLLGSTRDQWTALADLGRAPGALSEEEVFASIDEELKRASQSARQRRMRS